MKTKSKSLPLIIQKKALLSLFPDSKVEIRRNSLRWEGNITPSYLSETYKLKLQYKFRHTPKIFVVSPELRYKDGQRPPHLYREGNLCLYYPPYKEWNSSHNLATSFIPWASEWLYYYEVWLATGNWHGGGIHP